MGVGGWGITEKREKVKNNRVSSLVYWVDNVNENWEKELVYSWKCLYINRLIEDYSHDTNYHYCSAERLPAYVDVAASWFWEIFSHLVLLRDLIKGAMCVIYSHVNFKYFH